MAEKILFLDRDGTLIHEPDDFQVDALDKIQLVDDVIPSLLEIARHGYRFVMVSNQDGLGTDAFPQSDFDAPHALIMQLFTSQGIEFDEILICPHLPEDSCDCRKPRTGLLTRFLAANDIDLAASAVIGDRQTDMQLAENIGVRGLLVNCDDPPAITWPQPKIPWSKTGVVMPAWRPDCSPPSKRGPRPPRSSSSQSEPSRRTSST